MANMPERRYRIRQGDTLRALAHNYGFPGKSAEDNLRDLRSENKWLHGPDDVPEPWNPGQQLSIPMGWSVLPEEFLQDDSDPKAGLPK